MERRGEIGSKNAQGAEEAWKLPDAEEEGGSCQALKLPQAGPLLFALEMPFKRLHVANTRTGTCCLLWVPKGR